MTRARTRQPHYVVPGDWWACPNEKFHRVELEWSRSRGGFVLASCGLDFPNVLHQDDVDAGEACTDCASQAGTVVPAHLEVER